MLDLDGKQNNRLGVLLTLAMVVTLLSVLTHATPALSQETSTVGVSNLDEPATGYVCISFDQEYAQSFCTGTGSVTLEKVRIYTRSNGSDSAPELLRHHRQAPRRVRHKLQVDERSLNRRVSQPA